MAIYPFLTKKVVRTFLNEVVKRIKGKRMWNRSKGTSDQLPFDDAWWSWLLSESLI